MAEQKKDASKQMLQEKLIEYEMLKEEAKKLEQELHTLEARREELDIVSMSIDEIKGQKNKDILIPVGSGVFVKGTVTDDKKILLNVGSNVILPKTLEEAKKIIEGQITEMEQAKINISIELQKFIAYIQRISPEIQKLSQA